MADKPLKTPEWNSDGSNRTEPAEGVKDTGWTANQKPIPSSQFNWWMNLVWQWLVWLDDRVTNIGGTAPRIGFRGIGSTGEANGSGIDATGHGTGQGVLATGGGTNATGVEGVGGATDGKGVHGKGTGTGAGVHGQAMATGYGVIAEADTTTPAKAALRVVPQDADPATAPALGDIYVNSVTKQIRHYDGSAWKSIAAGNVVTIGDGVSSWGDFNGADKVPFTNAIAALPSGGIIFVKRGTYTFADTLSITTANISIIGEGRNIVHIQGSIPADAVISVGTVRNVVLRDLHVKQTHLSSSVAIRLGQGTTEAVVDHCFVEHTGAGGVGSTAVCRGIEIRGARCEIINNYVEIQNVAEELRRAAICLYSESDATDANGCHHNVVAHNIVNIVKNAGDSTVAAPIMLLGEVTGSSNGYVRYNVVQGNAILNSGNMGGGGIRLEGRFGGGSYETSIQYNSIIGNIIPNDGEPQSGSIYLVRDNADSLLTGNCIVGNYLMSGGVIFDGVGGTNNSNSLGLAGKWVAASSGGAVTTQITDTMLNRA